MKRLLHRILLWSSLVASTAVSFAQTSKIAPDLQSLITGLLTPVNVVVQYNSAPGLLGITELLSLGGTITQQYSSIPAVAVTLPAPVVSLLALNPAVSYISPDRQVQGILDLSAAASGADVAYQAGYTGKGIGVAIVDSGIYNHPDLASRIVYRQSFVAVDQSGRLRPRHARGGHRGQQRRFLHRSAIHAHVPRHRSRRESDRPARARLRNGMSSDSIVIAAIDRAISLKSQYNIRVMNLSIGRPIFESYRLDPVCAAVTAAWKQGIVVVVAAGNLGRDGYATITSPGNDPYAITVGAMKTDGNAADQRRPDRQLQLAGADLDRSGSQARHRGAGQSGSLAAGAGLHAVAGVSAERRAARRITCSPAIRRRPSTSS